MVGFKAKRASEEKENKVVDTTINTEASANDTKEEVVDNNTAKKEETKKSKAESRKISYENAIMKKYGLKRSDFEGDLDGQEVSVMKHVSACEDASKYVARYNARLKDNDIKNTYFTKEDGKIFTVVTEFFSKKLGTPMGEMAMTDLFRHMNIRARQMCGKPFRDEMIEGKAVRHSYETGKVVKLGFYKINALKEAAWMATHSFITGIFLDEAHIFNIIPKNNKDVYEKWNEYIKDQEDIPDDVKKIFILDAEGKCDFLESRKDKFTVVKTDEDKVVENIEESSDDTTVKSIKFNIDEKKEEDSSSDELNMEAKIEEQNKALDEECHNAIALDDEKEKVAMKVDTDTKSSNSEVSENPSTIPESQPDEKSEFTFGSLKTDDQPNVENQDQSEYKHPQDFVQTLDLNGFNYNNISWHNAIPKLEKFTNIVNKCNYQVMYYQNPVFRGLVNADIFVTKTGAKLRTLLIDPYIIYGDTLRIIAPADNNCTNLFKELFIPISQENIVVKAVKGILTKDDVKRLHERLPRVLTDFRNKYHFLERVDMRGILTDGRMGMPFNDWVGLVMNISNILKDPNVPNCRMRLVDVDGKDKFSLVCDDKVLSISDFEINHNEDTMNAFTKGLYIAYDESIPGDVKYSINYINSAA